MVYVYKYVDVLKNSTDISDWYQTAVVAYVCLITNILAGFEVLD